MFLAGTGKEGKTKEVVKDREGKMVGMYVCMYSVPQEDRKVFSGCYVLKTDGKILTRHPENRRENFDRNFEEKFPDENFANMGPRQLKSNTCSYMQF